MKAVPEVFLKHILDSIELIEQYTKRVPQAHFNKIQEKQDAVIRRIEIVGEAARNIPSEYRKKHPNVPWRDIMDMRNKIIHEYFGVDIDLVWDVVKKDIPVLKKEILKVLQSAK